MGTAECACNIVRIDHQMLGIDLLATGQHNRALQNILELSDIARPSVALKLLDGGLGDFRNIRKAV